MRFLLSTILFGSLIVCLQCHPLQGVEEFPEIELSPQEPEPNRFKQEDPDEEPESATTQRGPSFGAQVAQIINGAVSGNLDSILKGSFNLVPDNNVRDRVVNSWETIAGITSTTVAPSTTTAASTTVAVVKTEVPSSTTEAVEEVESETETDAPSTTVAGTNNEDDDDDEDAEEEAARTGNNEEDKDSVFSRSKVLRVI